MDSREYYERLGMADLRELVQRRAVTVAGDSRLRKNLVEALVRDDRLKVNEEEARKREEALKPKSPDEMSDLEKRLAKKVPNHPSIRFTGPNRVYNPVDEMLQVRNLPAGYVHHWASLATGGGEGIGAASAKGWVRAEARDCTMDPSDTSKIFVASFEDYNGWVKHHDCLLMIASRRIVEDRKAEGRRNWNAKFVGLFGDRGSTRETRGAITDEQGHTMRTEAQWRPEEGMREGNG